MPRMGHVVDLKSMREERAKQRRKLDPNRLALVHDIAKDHPEWGPEDLEKVHAELDSWGE
jgi:hypothetical protein